MVNINNKLNELIDKVETLTHDNLKLQQTNNDLLDKISILSADNLELKQNLNEEKIRLNNVINTFNKTLDDQFNTNNNTKEQIEIFNKKFKQIDFANTVVQYSENNSTICIDKNEYLEIIFPQECDIITIKQEEQYFGIEYYNLSRLAMLSTCGIKKLHIIFHELSEFDKEELKIFYQTISLLDLDHLTISIFINDQYNEVNLGIELIKIINTKNLKIELQPEHDMIQNKIDKNEIKNTIKKICDEKNIKVVLTIEEELRQKIVFNLP
jgi:hypothetical protein